MSGQRSIILARKRKSMLIGEELKQWLKEKGGL